MNQFQTENRANRLGRMVSVVVVLLCLFAACSQSKPVVENKSAKFQQEVTLFPWNNHYGISATVILDESTKCADIPKLWQHKVSSVNTHGRCVKVCSKNDCKGKCIELSPGSPSHNRLRDLNFDKMPISVGVCKDKGKNGKKNKNQENQVIEKLTTV